jgi:hypothetical protein
MKAWQPQVISGGPAAAAATSHAQPLWPRSSAALRRLRTALGRGRAWLQPRRGLVLRSTGRIVLAALVFYALGPFVGLLVALLLWFAQTQLDEPPPPPSAKSRLRAI